MTTTKRGRVRTDGGTDGAAWRVGSATRIITPDRPIRLAGYGNRHDLSDGAIQDLHAKAVAFEDADGGRAVVVSVEVLGITRDLRADVESACAEAHDLPPSALLLNASHTHHGPEYRVDEWDLWNTTDDDDDRAREYRERLESEIVDAVGGAIADLTPADLRYTHARCGFAMNRRRPTPEGYALDQHPDGVVDHDVPVLVARVDGEVETILFGYACHATSFPKSDRFHGDWPGCAMANLEELYPGATAAFVAGCGADQNPYPRREAEWTEQHGRSMSTAVKAAIDAGGKPVTGSLATCLEETTLEFEDQPGREELERRVDPDDEGVPPFDVGSERYARRLLDELDRDGKIRTEFPYPVQAIGFGSGPTLVALAGEVPVDYSRDIGGALEGDVWIAGYSNHGYVYVPNRRHLREGGYEAEWVYVYWDYPAPLKPSVGDRIAETAVALAERAGARRSEPSP